jgi:flagellar motor switch/type III secretory pathway protein FliN
VNHPVRWRPLCAADLDHTAHLVDEALGKWQRDWFGSPANEVVEVKPLQLLARGEELRFPATAEVFQCGTALWWSLSPGASLRLASHALDLPDPNCSPASGYSPLLAALGNRIAGELGMALASLLPAAHGDPARPLPGIRAASPVVAGEGGVVVQVTSANKTELGQVFCPASLIRSRAAFPVAPTASGRAPLVTISDAVSLSEACVDVRLGHIELTLGELIRLERGDVIRLAQRLDETVELVTGDSATAHPSRTVGAARLGRTGKQLSIKIESLEAEASR